MQQHRHRFGLEMHDRIAAADLIQIRGDAPLADLQRCGRLGLDAFAEGFHHRRFRFLIEN